MSIYGYPGQPQQLEHRSWVTFQELLLFTGDRRPITVEMLSPLIALRQVEVTHLPDYLGLDLSTFHLDYCFHDHHNTRLCPDRINELNRLINDYETKRDADIAQLKNNYTRFEDLISTHAILRTDPKYIAAVSQRHLSIVGYATNEFRSNQGFIIPFIAQANVRVTREDIPFIADAPRAIKGYQNKEELCNQWESLVELSKNNQKPYVRWNSLTKLQLSNPDIVLKASERHLSIVEQASPNLRENKEFLLQFIRRENKERTFVKIEDIEVMVQNREEFKKLQKLKAKKDLIKVEDVKARAGDQNSNKRVETHGDLVSFEDVKAIITRKEALNKLTIQSGFLEYRDGWGIINGSMKFEDVTVINGLVNLEEAKRVARNLHLLEDADIKFALLDCSTFTFHELLANVGKDRPITREMLAPFPNLKTIDISIFPGEKEIVLDDAGLEKLNTLIQKHEDRKKELIANFRQNWSYSRVVPPIELEASEKAAILGDPEYIMEICERYFWNILKASSELRGNKQFLKTFYDRQRKLAEGPGGRGYPNSSDFPKVMTRKSLINDPDIYDALIGDGCTIM